MPLVRYPTVLLTKSALLLPDWWLTATDLSCLVFIFYDFIVHTTLYNLFLLARTVALKKIGYQLAGYRLGDTFSAV